MANCPKCEHHLPIKLYWYPPRPRAFDCPECATPLMVTGERTPSYQRLLLLLLGSLVGTVLARCNILLGLTFIIVLLAVIAVLSLEGEPVKERSPRHAPNQGGLERHEADASNPWFKKPGGWARGNGSKAAAARERRDPT